MSVRRRRELETYRLENALADARRRYEVDRPVRMGDHWVSAATMRSIYGLARFNATVWARIPLATNELDGTTPEARMQAATGAQEVVRPDSVAQPWHDQLDTILRDGGKVGAPNGIERRALPWQAVSEAALAGRVPVAILRVIESAVSGSGRPARVITRRLAIDPQQIGTAEALTRRDGEHVAASTAVEREQMVAIVRQPDGRALLVGLNDYQFRAEARAGASAEASAGTSAGAPLFAPRPSAPSVELNAAGTATWRAGVSGIETLAAPDGIIRFPAG
ncbi:MAG: hypothetical protein H7123_05230 [Thermoleophilia bacterium]|nr:hypothetical protein [Thermoleophilia bacterium]